eukprot:778525-Amphidinium_carterae.1
MIWNVCKSSLLSDGIPLDVASLMIACVRASSRGGVFPLAKRCEAFSVVDSENNGQLAAKRSHGWFARRTACSSSQLCSLDCAHSIRVISCLVRLTCCSHPLRT